MSGIYIHIPFCKQACHYCNFHFSTNMKKKEEMIGALIRELELRKGEFAEDELYTIYFGGGTPSVLNASEIEQLLDAVYQNYRVAANPEITLEANPDDLSEYTIKELSSTAINRLSIGVQSFFEEDLKLMNRAHNAKEAEDCIKLACTYFNNISIDLIYGTPGMSNERWAANIEKALSFQIPHISSYALTVEPKTALKAFIEKGVIAPVEDELAEGHFQILIEKLSAAGFIQYEFSNFGKQDYFSQNNTAYWKGKKYLGIGPSAHSFDGIRRGWNVENNTKYIKSIAQGILPMETEVLSTTDRFNEYMMTGMRTIWGVSLQRIRTEFGEDYYSHLLKEAAVKLDKGLLVVDNEHLLVTPKGKFLCDGIASDLFMVG
ncbi:radical SAM family heme chaperone HemW [Arenibacter amylolyticus]|uniref:radical SAM family heme chaperone HemW n=1 Tax=Arenibacter amylolyticus TaxID=1406873 RepID=UPI000A385C2F|nr:radical SAM family heme chaperone HemW [Arenibacter amylolyticus]